MKKLIGMIVGVILLTGCSGVTETQETSAPTITIEYSIGPSDLEQEAVAEAQRLEGIRLAAEARLKEEARLAEEARVAEIVRQQEIAAQQLQERLRQAPPAPVYPPPPIVAPVTPSTPQWMIDLQNQYGTYMDPSTEVYITGSTPCGGSAAGCVTQRIWSDGRRTEIKLYLIPSAEGVPFLFFHEVAHTQGITNECAADQFARRVLGSTQQGVYC